MATTGRITKTLTLSYVMSSDVPFGEFDYPRPTDRTGGVTLIPDDLSLLGPDMELTASELAPLIAKKRTSNFTFEYVSGISERPVENSREVNPQKVTMKTRFWRQVPSAGPIQNAVKLSVKTLKREGAYANIIEDTPTNDLSKSMFAFKVIEMMTSCGMEPLADELVSYVGVGKAPVSLRIDSAYKNKLGGFREFNYGCVLLKILNESLELSEFMRGRYIANEKGQSIIQGSTVLRRSPRVIGPINCGNPVINGGDEVIYEAAGYFYDYGMYGRRDPGTYAQERDDQDAVIEFPVE
jgi:hypothetical protein